MSPLGVTVSTSTAPPVSGPPTNTGTLFAVGRGDTGSQAAALKVGSISDVINAIGARSATNSVLYDALDAYFREGGVTAYLGRVVGPAPVNATLALNDPASAVTLTITAASPGAVANSQQVVVTLGSSATFTANTTNTSTSVTNVSSFANIGVGTPVTGTGIPANTWVASVNTAANSLVLSSAATATTTGVVLTPSNFTIVLQDALGNQLLNSGALINQAAAVAWGTAQTLITVTAGVSVRNPAALVATNLAGGTDDFASATLTHWTNALNLFSATLGPGQVAAPGILNSAVSGIWSTLLTHAASVNNRFALLDVDAGVTIPGVTSNTTRTCASSAVIAALCARVDRTGNPNQAAAGGSFPLQYVIGQPAVVTTAATLLSNVASITTSTLASYGGFFAGAAYNAADTLTLNNGGVNAFANRFGVLQNYGFSTPVSQTSDQIYWQASHSRLRMALVANAQAVGEPFVFAQIDGKGNTIATFGAAIANMLTTFYNAGALYGATPNDAFLVNVGAQVNTPTSIASGVLRAAASVRMSPFAQSVLIDLAAIPVTQAVRAV